MTLDIRVEFEASSPDAWIEELCESLPDRWSRDGILEHQVSTREEFQYCFRRAETDEIPRSALCLAGPRDVLTVATVVPIDRGVELSDEQIEAVVSDFYEEIVQPASHDTPVSSALVDEDASSSAPS